MPLKFNTDSMSLEAKLPEEVKENRLSVHKLSSVVQVEESLWKLLFYDWSSRGNHGLHLPVDCFGYVVWKELHPWREKVLLDSQDLQTLYHTI